MLTQGLPNIFAQAPLPALGSCAPLSSAHAMSVTIGKSTIHDNCSHPSWQRNLYYLHRQTDRHSPMYYSPMYYSGSGSQRRSSPAAMTLISRYSLRLRTHTPVRTQTAVRTRTLVQSPVGVKRTPSLELVSFGRHKLRRLSPNPSRTGRKRELGKRGQTHMMYSLIGASRFF
jgi:hypothetical protein